MLNKKNISELFWVVIGNTTSVFGILIMLKIFTKQLDQVEYGIYYLSLTGGIFINQIFFGPLGNGVSRYFLISEIEEELYPFLSAAFSIVKKTIKILSVLLLISIIFFLIKSEYKYIVLLFSTYFTSIFTGFTAIIFSLQNIKRERSIVAKFQIFDAFLKLIIVYLLLYFFNKTANTVALALVISSFVVFMLQLYYLKKKSSYFFIKKIKSDFIQWESKIFNYSYPFAIWGVFTWAQISSDRWFLGTFTNIQSIAIYAVLFQIGYYPLTILIGYIVQIVTPVLFTRAGDGKDKKMLKKSSQLNFKIAIVSILITIFGFVFILFFHGFFMTLLTSHKYYKASIFLPFMVLSGGLFATSQILSLDFLAQLNVKKLLIIKVCTSIAGIISSFYLIKNYGLSGAVYSNLFFSGLYLMSISVFVFFNYKIKDE